MQPPIYRCLRMWKCFLEIQPHCFTDAREMRSWNVGILTLLYFWHFHISFYFFIGGVSLAGTNMSKITLMRSDVRIVVFIKLIISLGSTIAAKWLYYIVLYGYIVIWCLYLMLCSYDRKYCEAVVNLKKVERIVSTCKRLDRLTFKHPDVGICIVPHTNTKRTRRGSGKLVLWEKKHKHPRQHWDFLL